MTRRPTLHPNPPCRGIAVTQPRSLTNADRLGQLTGGGTCPASAGPFSTGPWKYPPRPHSGGRVDIFQLFATAAAAVLVASFVFTMSTKAMTERAAAQLNAQIQGLE